mgnify:CR=1 FL=1
MNISRKVSCLLLSGALLFAGFSATAQAAELLVSGAASLTNAFNEMKDAFQKKYPDVKRTPTTPLPIRSSSRWKPAPPWTSSLPLTR